MKIKKYEAKTEQEAINKVKDDLGLNALILNIKKTQPQGFFAFFRRPVVEVTAAYEEKQEKTDLFEMKNPLAAMPMPPPVAPTPVPVSKPQIDPVVVEQREKIEMLEKKLLSTEDLLEKVVTQITASVQNEKIKSRKYENTMIQLFYDTLLDQGVTKEIAENILNDIDMIDEGEKIDINLLVKIVYNTIMSILGEPETVTLPGTEQREARYIVFMGPTGVGKTTTIAKLSSDFILNKNLKVGLITADTYRIAAIEQLKTYADIFGIEVGVVYNSHDLKQQAERMGHIKDIVLIDTAGRSHKNDDNLKELGELLSCIPEGEKYLVLSLTTKYEDLLNIISRYSSIADFKIIFTKSDETTCLGAILNICYTVGKKISYITYGQNVPDDIEIIKPEKIAKSLLGAGGDYK